MKRADELLGQRGHPPLPAGVTAHELRRTFASILVALGGDPTYVVDQVGHTDPEFTLRVYAHQMRRNEGDRDELARLVGAPVQAETGRSSASAPFQRTVTA